MHFGRWAAAGFLCGLGLAACKSSGLNDEHCANNDGDATCLSLYPDGSRPFCGRGSCFVEAPDGCIADRPADDACWSPCGGQMSADDPDGRLCLDGGTATGDDGGVTTGPTGGGPGTAGPDTDTEPSGMTEGATDGSGTATDDGPMGCSGDEDCTDADAPFCVDMLCAPCTATGDPDAACAEKFPETPACVASACVQCSAEVTEACMGNTPVCDTTTSTCVQCASHDECPGGAACHMAADDSSVGECFPADAVFYVDGDAAGCDDGGPGTMATPWCSLQPHIDALAAGEAATLYVGELAGAFDYPAVDVTGGRDIALLAMDGQQPRFEGTTGSTLSVSGTNTDVYIEGLRMSGNEVAVAVTVSDGVLLAQRCEIVGNDLGGILVENDAHLHVENSFIGQPNDVISVDVQSSTAVITYSTLATSTFASTPALSCNAAATMTVRNSIIVNQGGSPGSEIACTIDTAAGNATEAEAGPFPAMPSDWFAGYAGGDYHLSATGDPVFAGLAVWNDGDPLADIEGDARPGTDGAMDYAGADVP